MQNNNRYIGLTVLALAMCIAPPLVTTLYQFPIWIETSAKCTVSGLGVLLMVISIVPIFKAARKFIKSPSIPFVWAVIAGAAFMIRAVVDQVCIIAVVGTISSCVGWVLFKIRDKKYSVKKEE